MSNKKLATFSHFLATFSYTFCYLHLLVTSSYTLGTFSYIVAAWATGLPTSLLHDTFPLGKESEFQEETH